MSAASLNVWITRVGDPCHIDNDHKWFVHVLDCDGKVVEWCGKPLMNFETKCGHADITVPPGCYTVCATWSPGTSSDFLGNHLTHVQIVRVNCGDHACVTLFPPTLHHCRTWFEHAMQVHAELGALDRDAVANAIKAIGVALAEVKRDPFTEAMEVLAPRRE
jgi:hypothetical protein